MVDSLINGLTIALLTNAIGLIIFLLGQIILFLVIKPYKELREKIEEVDYTLSYHSNIYTNPLTVMDRHGHLKKLNEQHTSEEQIKVYISVSNDLRRAAIALMTKAKIMPSVLYKFFGFSLFGLPSFKNIHEAYGNLIFLSNSTITGDPETNKEKAIEVNKLLRI